LKNAIDYAEDMRADERVYLAERAVGIIVCADGIQAMGSTLNSRAFDRACAEGLAGRLLRRRQFWRAAVRTGRGLPEPPRSSRSLRPRRGQVVEFARMKIADKDAAASLSPQGAPVSSAELAERMTQMEMTFRLMG